MKKIYKGSALVGILASSLMVNGQSGSAAGAAGGTAGAGVAGGGVSPTAGAAAARAGASGVNAGAVGVNQRGGSVNTIGAAGINQPAASTPIGGASVIGTAPNTVAGSSITQQSPGAPAAAGTVGTLPGSGTLPAGSAAQQVNPNVGAVAPGTVAVTPGTVIGGVQAGLPLTSLPTDLQQRIQATLGSAQVQTISRDDLANGSVFRVTALQNGVPTEFRFGANGVFMGSTALPGGAATSFVTPGVIPGGGPLILDSLPAAVQSTVRGQTGNGTIASIIPQGQAYLVTYTVNGRPTTMLVGPDGRILRAGPTAIGNPPPAAVGTGGSTNAPTNNTRTSSIRIDELPDEVRTTLNDQAADANVQFINREKRASGDVYVVGARSGDDYLQLTIDENGRVIRDTRDVPVVAVGAPKMAQEDLTSGIPFSRVPVAIQNAVKAYATAAEVRSVNLGLDNGRTVYDVVYMRDGRRDRMIVAKDGSLLRMERDVSPALDNSTAAPRLAIGDLPSEVQDTIRRQTDNVLVKKIATKRLGDQVVYSVSYETNGAPVELLVDSRGTMIVPQASAENDLPGTPRPAPIPDTEEEPVRVANAAATTPTTEGVGASPSTETRVETSVTATEAKEAPVQSVALSDVPVAVQNSAKKLAGAGVIEAINPKLGDSGVIYEVVLSHEGQRQTLRLNKDGAVRQEDLSK